MLELKLFITIFIIQFLWNTVFYLQQLDRELWNKSDDCQLAGKFPVIKLTVFVI